MSNRKISFTGEQVFKVEQITAGDQIITTADDAEGEMVALKESYVITESARGFSKEQRVDLTDDDLVEFTFDDGTTWFSNPENIDDVFPEAANQARSADETFHIPAALRNPAGERGLVSDITLKLIKVFSKKTVTKSVRELAASLEKKALDNQSGLYKVDEKFNLTKAAATVSTKPWLLFLHGTASSSKGSFSELVKTPVWTELMLLYGANILAFQHESLTKSPLLNAVELVEQLPPTAELHLVSHSRGGLIGDILSRFCNANENKRGFDQDEKDYLEKTRKENDQKVKEDLDNIRKLEEILEKKKIRISRFVRVACPANGTILASKRLDNLLNITLNLVGMGTGIAANPVYGAFKNLIAGVVDTKNQTEGLPGLEAMNPASPFIKVLNNPSSTIEIDDPLVVISGNCNASFDFKALLIIASNLFYRTDNDLVVNTLSMYQGSKRRNNLTYLYDNNENVDHFHYFKNDKTSKALLDALKPDSNLITAGFKTKEQHLLAIGQRNAILKLEGGGVFTAKVTGAKPIVVLLPGIMGSNLTVENQEIWINYWQFIKGGLKKLDVTGPGPFAATSLVGTSYRRLVKYLEPEYDVVTFPYDWRMPLTDAADIFKEKIEKLLTYRQPIKIIGHSMGGVLVRDFILKHPKTWDELNGSKNFKLVFLGSPLGGSFRIPAVLFGQDPIIDKLSKIDIKHTKKELLDMFSKFQGLLSLLPLNIDPKNDFANEAIWKEMSAAMVEEGWALPDENNLKVFKDYRDTIINGLNSIDYTNVVYIAGKDKATPCGYRIADVKKGKETVKELVFLSTGEGDQSVTWESGIPKKMLEQNAVYFVDVTHGALANEPKIFEGISEILSKGATGLLKKTKPVVRSEEKVFKMPVREDFDLSEAGVESTLLGLDAQAKEPATEVAQLEVVVSNGHLKYAAFPVLAGHFAKDGILNAEGAVDTMLEGALSERLKLGIYPGPVGTSEVIIASGNNGVKGGIIVGLGSFGELTGYLLTSTVEQGVSKYLLETNSKLSFKNQLSKAGESLGISTLIIGSGYGGLTIENSVRSILQGIQNANAKIGMLHKGHLRVIEQVEFVELYEDRALSCFQALGKIEKDPDQPLSIRFSKKEIKKRYGSKKRIASETSESWWTRITVTMEKPKPNAKLFLNPELPETVISGKKDKTNPVVSRPHLYFSISTGGAREEKRDLFVNPAGIESLIIDSSVNNLWSSQIAKTLFEMLIPVDFKEQLKRQGNINWILDKDTAAYPWELLQDRGGDAKPLSVNAGMIRQLGTRDYRMQINAVAGNTAMVVGDPLLNGFLPPLPGAEAEARMVVKVLGENGFEIKHPLIQSNARQILQGLHEGYKIIHLAGHGIFNKEEPGQSGMVIGENNFLTSADIANMSTVPELVFINCCYLGQMSSEAEEYYRNVYKLAANIGTQLIENGVKAVVAAGWAVSDKAALLFAQKFYEEMFEGECFGDAVQKARQAVFQEHSESNTWGAYQCYGDPFYKLRDDDRQTKKKKPKEFVIAEEAEIALNNLYNEIKSGSYDQDWVLDELAAILKAVEMAGIGNADITEKEGLMYAELLMYDAAVAKFQELLAMEKADFSVSTLEKYSNVRMKKYVSDYFKALNDGQLNKGKREEWLKNAREVIGGIESLLQISPTAERYNLLGSAYKRKGILCSTDAQKLEAYKRAAHYYKLALDKQPSSINAITNWYALESILVIAEAHTWGESVMKDDQELYRLPPQNEAMMKLQSISDAYKPNQQNLDYWVLVEVPNCKLCLLIVEPNFEKKNWDDVLIAYQKVWNLAGSKADKFTEIEHLQLLSDALHLSKKEPNGLKERIDALIKEMEKVMY